MPRCPIDIDQDRAAEADETAASAPSEPGPATRDRALAAEAWESPLLLHLALWVPFALLVRRFFAHTTDDAFIPLRYGWNLLHGNGLVFNVGERVEGVTSPLHLVVATAVVAVPGGSTLLLLKLVTLGFAGLALWWGSRLLLASDLPPWAILVGAVLLGGNWMLAFNAGNGLETAMTCALVTATVAILVRDGASRWRSVGVVALLASVARPEAALIVAMLGLTSLIVERDLPRWQRVRWTAVAGTGFVTVTALRWLYYGDVVPNTFYAKLIPGHLVVDQGIDYLLDAIVPGSARMLAAPRATATVLLVVVGALMLVGGVDWLRRRHRMAYCVLPVAAQMYSVVAVGGDWMPGGRFLAPVALLMVLVTVNGAVVIVGALEPRMPVPATLLRASACMALVGLAVLNASRIGIEPISRITGWSDGALLASGGYGDSWTRSPELFECARPGDLVVFSEMGYGPWRRTDLRFIDARGLVTEAVAKEAAPHARHTWGVADPDWTDASNATVRETLRRRPHLVVTFAPDPPAEFGDGLYTTEGIASPIEGYTSYRRADVTCDTPPGS